jgi:hypothetical protein
VRVTKESEEREKRIDSLKGKQREDRGIYTVGIARCWTVCILEEEMQKSDGKAKE